MNIADLQRDAHAMAIEKGWYSEGEDRCLPSLIALMHSELSEALESWREGHGASYMDGCKPEGWGVELADCIIRTADACTFYGIDLDDMLKRKMAYNATRPHRHGGKRA